MNDQSTTNDEQPRKRQKLSEPRDDAKSVRDKDSRAAEPSSQEKEKSCGLTHYVEADLVGFSGTLKQRYTDFLVNEILPNGEVLYLRQVEPAPKQGTGKTARTDTNSVKQPVSSNGASTTADGGGDAGAAPSEASIGPTEAEINEVKGAFGDERTEKLLDFYSKVTQAPEKKPRDFKNVELAICNTKEERTTAHKLIRRVFNNALESTTNDENAIIVSKAPKANPHRQQGRGSNGRPHGKLGWAELGGEYLHFSLYKENKDTMEIVSFLGSQMKMNAKTFQFAGTKDRRAVTVQQVCAYRIEVDRLRRLAAKLRAGTKIGDFHYQPNGLELGDLAGNEFVITLRDCHFANEEPQMSTADRIALAERALEQTVAAFQDNGFINYYGLQRFGSFAQGTATVGLKMLQGDFEGAINSIMDFSPAALAEAEAEDKFNGEKTPSVIRPEEKPALLISSDDRQRAHVISVWQGNSTYWSGPPVMPRKFIAEGNIIRHLSKSGSSSRQKDYLGALQSIPRNLRLMYVHAYQSLVWNKAASHRWSLYGDKVVEGDLVVVSEHLDKSTDGMENDQRREAEAEIDVDGEVIIQPPSDSTHANSSNATGAGAAGNDPHMRARPLTAEEAASGEYSIFDIVLTLPGYDVIYPSNAMKDFYVKYMGSKEGGGLDPFDMKRKWKDASLTGGYRKVLAKPLKGGEVAYEIKSYRREVEQLVETDLEKIHREEREAEGKAAEQTETTTAEPTEEKDAENMDVDAKPGDAEEDGEEKIAVILRFQLGTSQYATVALRELMKEGGVKNYQPEFLGGR